MIWKSIVPLKIVLFAWLVLGNKIVTWENLRKGSWEAPGRSGLCGDNEETTCHLFILCPFAQAVWTVVMRDLNFLGSYREESVEQCLFTWLCDVHSQSFRDIPYLVWWGIWLQRNKVLIEGQMANSLVMSVQVESLWKELGGAKKGVKSIL